MATAILEETVEKVLMTADELLAMPKDGFRYELIEGELRKMEPAGFFHGATGGLLLGPLISYIQQNDLGVILLAETGFKVGHDPDTILAPDIAFIQRENVPNPWPKYGFFVGVPDLAVEVVSPSETMESVDEKVQKYLEAGTRLVWILRPLRRRIEVHRANGESVFLTDKDILRGEDVVPGFELPVNRIFR